MAHQMAYHSVNSKVPLMEHQKVYHLQRWMVKMMVIQLAVWIHLVLRMVNNYKTVCMIQLVSNFVSLEGLDLDFLLG